MSETPFPRDDAEFEPFAASYAAGTSAEYEGTNVCRAAGIAMFAQAAGRRFDDLRDRLEPLGFRGEPAQYAEMLQFGRLAGQGAQSLAGAVASAVGELARIEAWDDFTRDADTGAAWRYLAGLLGGSSERESAAAAAAVFIILASAPGVSDALPYGWLTDVGLVWDEHFGFGGLPILPMQEWDVVGDAERAGVLEWDGAGWQAFCADYVAVRLGDDLRPWLFTLAWVRLRLAIASADQVARELAHAALYRVEPAAAGFEEEPPRPATASGALTVSTLVHGTWGWKGDWWRPSGDFHDLVLTEHRPNLYNRGARFSWSGALSEKHRRIAGNDFRDWIGEVAPHGLQTVFAHSYGGEVVARAAIGGANIHEAVLLSVPADPYVVGLAALKGVRVVDIRTPFDPVLALTGWDQQIPGVPPILLPWHLSHTASHKRAIWERYDVAKQAKI